MFVEMYTELASRLHGSTVEVGIVRMNVCKTAAAMKIVENIFRDVNIALMSELAHMFEKMENDTWDIIRGASSKPFAITVRYRGPEAGGGTLHPVGFVAPFAQGEAM